MTHKSLDERMDAIEHLISGNGEPGLNERVRTIERGMHILNRIAWMTLTCVGALVLGRLWSLLQAAPVMTEAAQAAP
ncbi:MAG: hypothetical protein AAGI37_18175 [Planctomycetota bacterium]